MAKRAGLVLDTPLGRPKDGDGPRRKLINLWADDRSHTDIGALQDLDASLLTNDRSIRRFRFVSVPFRVSFVRRRRHRQTTGQSDRPTDRRWTGEGEAADGLLVVCLLLLFVVGQGYSCRL